MAVAVAAVAAVARVAVARTVGRIVSAYRVVHVTLIQRTREGVEACRSRGERFSLRSVDRFPLGLDSRNQSVESVCWPLLLLTRR